MAGMIHETRIQHLNNLRIQKGRIVLYWMQQSQRCEYNHALEYAVREANRLNLQLLVVFGLTDRYPEANLRHYTFLLEGLQETQKTLARRGIKLVVQLGNPPQIALSHCREQAALLVCDRGYLRHQKAWRREVAAKADVPVVQIESDVILPIEEVSEKAEFTARTIRTKILKHLERYLSSLDMEKIDRPSLDYPIDGVNLDDIEKVLVSLPVDRQVSPVSRFFRGGTSRAKKLFHHFLQHRLSRYEDHHNQPQTDDTSTMSPYLHFGQISPIYLALQIKKATGVPESAKAAYLEELIVRRELAVNFVFYNPAYDSFAGIPDWARNTLTTHKKDKRPYIYTKQQLESGRTHDPYWNAAMNEMKVTGFMHNYMRMYWGKKVLEWSASPEEAYDTLVSINNKYLVDGRDPNSYTGVGWIFGLHDRPWKERPIFGKVRTMVAAGLERKCDINAYLKKVEKRMAV